MWYVYVLRSTVRTRSYVGFAHDVDKRLAEHNAGRVASTRPGRPWQLIAVEKFETPLAARRHETFLKSTTGRRRLAQLFESPDSPHLRRI